MAQIQKKFIAPNSIDGSKIRLSNAEALRARNAANSADVSILSVDASDIIQFASVPQSPSDASNPNDLVRYSQLGALIDGMKPKQAVAVASASNIDLGTASDPSPVDGYTMVDGDRILLWGQTDAAENGIYDAVTAADPTTWTRSSDFNSPSEIPGSYTIAENGTVGQGTVYVCLSSPASVGTDPINFAIREISVTTLTGGDMITVGAGKISVDLLTNGGLKSSNPGNDAGQLEVSLESSNPSLQVDGSNGLGLKMDAAGALSKGSGGVSVNVDNSTIEIATDALQVKDAGITAAKLASDSVDENKIVSTALATDGALNGGSGTKLSVRVDGVTTKINGGNNVEGLKELEQKITLSGTDITNQYVDLAHAISGVDAANNSASLNVIGGPLQEKAVDYTVSLTGGSGGVTRVTFAGDLATGGDAALVSGDKVVVKYQYL